ncbi:hypothetical protein L1987_16191 [Smallanthus sonchifolius]|uniref:Uncharacterized protein n=1 Tax=Smallanthus sonchifolius TaxID=185202 RepID=A0ACB9J972_9ASTR|nr:hypothetical protein L1987_16191 [Smallanthus sonchifolius]
MIGAFPIAVKDEPASPAIEGSFHPSRVERSLRVKAGKEQIAWEERWPASWNPSLLSKIPHGLNFLFLISWV